MTMTTAATEESVYGPLPIGARGIDTTAGTDTPAQPPGPAGTTAGTGATAAPAADVNDRFLQFLIPAAATVASTFGPQIGSAIGGLVGGSAGSQAGGQIGGALGNVLGNLGGGLNLGGLFGGRGWWPGRPDEWMTDHPGFVSGPPSIDFTSPLLQHCTLQCVHKITPELAAMLKNVQPQLQPAGARSAEAEVGAVERFWPEITSFLTSQVGKHLPAILKTVTSTVMPLLGARDSAQFTPVLTGTEANARWFLPVLNSVITAVQQNLPQLLDLISGGTRAGRDISITWTDLAEYGRFWDNDFIRVIDQQDVADKEMVELVLELAPHLTWGKELHIKDDNGVTIKRLWVRDARKWDEAAVPASQILTNGSLLFAKAKMFGVMTGMYVMPTAGLDVLKGKRTHIRWMAD